VLVPLYRLYCYSTIAGKLSMLSYSTVGSILLPHHAQQCMHSAVWCSSALLSVYLLNVCYHAVVMYCLHYNVHRRGELGVVGLNGAVNIALGQSQFELAAVSRVLELPLTENDKAGAYKLQTTTL
jgi:hypothetical protein